MIDENNLDGFTNIEELDFRVSETPDLNKKIKLYQEALESEDFEINDKIYILKSIFNIYIENKSYGLQVHTLEELIEIDKINKIDYLKQIVQIYKTSDIKDYIVASDYQLKIIKDSKKPTDYFDLIELFSLSNDLENKKKYQRETIKLYNSLIDKNSSNETIVNGYRIKILELLLDLGDKNEIEEVYLEIIKKDSSSRLKYSLELAKFYEENLKSYPKAIKQYQNLISINNKDEVIYLENIAKLYEKIPNFSESISKYEELISKYSNKEEIYLIEILKLYKDKIKDYEKVVEKYNILESKFDKKYYKEKLAEFFKNDMKDYHEAIKIYSELTILNYSEKIKYFEAISSIYEDNLKEYDEAINQYENLILENSKNKEIYQKSIIRLLWNDKKDISNTINKIEEFFTSSPDDEEIKNILEKAKNIKESAELDVKGKIGENFEETENEFKKTLLIYMLLILNLVFLIIFFNKDIFFEKKEERDKRIEKIEKEKLNNLRKIELEELKNKEKAIKVDKKEIKKTQKNNDIKKENVNDCVPQNNNEKRWCIMMKKIFNIKNIVISILSFLLICLIFIISLEIKELILGDLVAKDIIEVFSSVKWSFYPILIIKNSALLFLLIFFITEYKLIQRQYLQYKFKKNVSYSLLSVEERYKKEGMSDEISKISLEIYRDIIYQEPQWNKKEIKKESSDKDK